MSDDPQRDWLPARYPTDAGATARIQEWLHDRTYSFVVVDLDLRGADLTGGDFSEGWLNRADLRGVRFADADLYRAHLGGADLTGADLSAADLGKSNLDEAVLRSARLDRANLGSATLSDVDARGADFRAVNFAGAYLLNVDLRGANLSDASMRETFFEVVVDDTTVVDGLQGSIFDPLTVRDNGADRELDGNEMISWLSERGARVVQDPRGA